MARLQDFIRYLDGRMVVLSTIDRQLCALQEKYEIYFSEISQVREREFQQLLGHIVEEPKKLPQWFDDKLAEARREVEREYDANVEALSAKHAKLAAQAEQQRRASLEAEGAMQGTNVALDRQEEALKARNEQLLAAIGRYNGQIRGLGGGFGFLANIFRLRRLAKDRARLDKEQADVAAHIEALRARWTQEAGDYVAEENAYRARWVELETEAAAHQTKLDYLSSARERIVLRSTLERVLYELAKEPAAPVQSDPACPRCRVPNPSSHHFCCVCAQRLTDDKPDFEGSLHEIAELNRHHRRFAEGMRACQEIIGLVRGLYSGHDAFKKSVVDMTESESKHNLAPLQLDVPAPSVQYGQSFDGLARSLSQDWSVHPKVLADRAQTLVSQVFTEELIQNYFETMGEELTRQADAQW